MTTMSSTSMNTESKQSPRADLSEATSHIREDLNSLRDDAQEAIGAATTCAKSGIDSAVEIAKVSGSKAKDVHSSLEDQVKKHPTSAVLITLGAGVLLGRLIARR